MKSDCTDDIIKDLETLIDNNSVYFLITKTDIRKIINKYNDLERYLSKKFELDYYDNNEGFGIILRGTSEFEVDEFIKDIKKKYNTNIVLNSIGTYEGLRQIILWFRFSD